jgi:hypothetical protein
LFLFSFFQAARRLIEAPPWLTEPFDEREGIASRSGPREAVAVLGATQT